MYSQEQLSKYHLSKYQLSKYDSINIIQLSLQFPFHFVTRIFLDFKLYYPIYLLFAISYLIISPLFHIIHMLCIVPMLCTVPML